MIVKNEQQYLQRVLESAKDICDEIIIVDTGSTDNTKDIAREFTKKVYSHKWVNDFSKARNYSFSKATMDYIMWLDADDEILPDDRDKMLELKKNLSPDVDIVTMRYAVSPSLYSTRGRWFRRLAKPTWYDEIHEYIPLVGNILPCPDISITHKPNPNGGKDPKRNLKIYQSIIERGGELSPRGKYYFARELKDNGMYDKAIQYFNLFLLEGKGWKEDNIASCFNLAICYNTIGQPDKAFHALVKSFTFDAPRHEICCLLGYYYKNKGDYNIACSWFETALGLPKKDSIGFVLIDYHVYIPAIELAVCYDKLKMHERANAFNEIAGKAKPSSGAYLYNKQYFETLHRLK